MGMFWESISHAQAQGSRAYKYYSLRSIDAMKPIVEMGQIIDLESLFSGAQNTATILFRIGHSSRLVASHDL
jgi:methionine salvage enolase-phosphatase E1